MLDIGGVLLPSAMPMVIRRLAAAGPRSEQQCWRFFQRELFEPFWGGRIAIGEFWERMLAFGGADGPRAPWDRAIAEHLVPLPGCRHVERWSGEVALAILSNQRHEWALPPLEAAGVLQQFAHVLISSRTGRVKPSPEAIAQLLSLGVPKERIAFVDDRPDVRGLAMRLGIGRVIEGDRDERWVTRVDGLLSDEGEFY